MPLPLRSCEVRILCPLKFVGEGKFADMTRQTDGGTRIATAVSLRRIGRRTMVMTARGAITAIRMMKTRIAIRKDAADVTGVQVKKTITTTLTTTIISDHSGSESGREDANGIGSSLKGVVMLCFSFFFFLSAFPLFVDWHVWKRLKQGIYRTHVCV